MFVRLGTFSSLPSSVRHYWQRRSSGSSKPFVESRKPRPQCQSCFLIGYLMVGQQHRLNSFSQQHRVMLLHLRGGAPVISCHSSTGIHDIINGSVYNLCCCRCCCCQELVVSTLLQLLLLVFGF